METTRIALTDDAGAPDGTGRWFDPQAAERFDEATYWDGRNHISKATGSQFDHEALFRTAGGRWVLHSWSQWQGSREVFVELTLRDAARWFAKNELEPHASCREEHAALEIA